MLTNKRHEMIDKDQILETYENLWSLVDNDEEYKLSDLESDILRHASKICHNLYLVAAYPSLTLKIKTGGIEDLK